MRKLLTLSLLSLCFIVFVPNSLGQTCAPDGIARVGPASNSFNFLANTIPNDDTCWQHVHGVFFETGVTSCSSGPTTSSPSTTNAFFFTFAGVLSQDIVIPATDTRTHFELDYLLDFDDPHNDQASNIFSTDVYDVTTNTLLYSSGRYTGSMPDLLCTRRSSPSMFFPGTLAGHTIRITFHGQSGYTDTHVRVYSMGFWGWN